MNSINSNPNKLHFGTSKTNKPAEGYRNNTIKNFFGDSKLDDKNKFVGATIIGAIMAAGVGGVVTGQLKEYESKKLIEDMAEEYSQEDTKSLKIEDLNNDKTKEIIIEKQDGTKCVYDLKNNQIYFDIDGEKIEKLR